MVARAWEAIAAQALWRRGGGGGAADFELAPGAIAWAIVWQPRTALARHSVLGLAGMLPHGSRGRGWGKKTSVMSTAGNCHQTHAYYTEFASLPATRHLQNQMDI